MEDRALWDSLRSCGADGLLSGRADVVEAVWGIWDLLGFYGAVGGQCGVVKVSLRPKEMNDHLVRVRECSAVPLSSVSSVCNPQFP